MKNLCWNPKIILNYIWYVKNLVKDSINLHYFRDFSISMFIHVLINFAVVMTFSNQIIRWSSLQQLIWSPVSLNWAFKSSINYYKDNLHCFFIGCFGEYLCSSSLRSYLCSDCSTASGNTWLHRTCFSFWKNSLWSMQACLNFYFISNQYLVKLK